MTVGLAARGKQATPPVLTRTFGQAATSNKQPKRFPLRLCVFAVPQTLNRQANQKSKI